MKFLRPEFTPALIVVDVQNDFLPPSGSLAVPNGDDIIPVVNTLLALPFTLRLATKDNHPSNHISFASSHPPPNNQPFTSTYTLTNPHDPSESVQSRLWPSHCVQDTIGWEFPHTLDERYLHHTVLKGSDPKIEQYSGFAGPFRRDRDGNAPDETELKRILEEKGVTHVYIVGLALDYCVKATALHAVERGFKTLVVKEGTRAVDENAVQSVYEELEKKGVRVVGMGGEEVAWVKEMNSWWTEGRRVPY